MHLVDWREPSVPSFSSVWRTEETRWFDRLAWDSRANWDRIEQQRRSGQLPGLVLLDGDAIAGWTFFLAHRDTLQVGGFETGSEDATRLLLDAILDVAEPSVARDGVMVFSFSDAPGLADALDRQQFECEPYLYLVRPLGGAAAPAAGFDWDPRAFHQLPALLARAYGAPALTRPFVRHGSPVEWQEYAAQLVQLHACGRFIAELSAASMSATGVLEGVVLTTAIQAKTAHVAQVSVDPDRQRRGLAEALLRSALAKAQSQGYERMSLLVGQRNERARQLYRRLGFTQVARFTSAGRGAYPRRSTRPAADTGGASTLR